MLIILWPGCCGGVILELSYLDGDDSVESLPFEFEIYHVARDDIQVGEAFLLGFAVDVDLLGLGVGKGRDFGVGESFCEV